MPGQAADSVPAGAAAVRAARPFLSAGDGALPAARLSAWHNESKLSPARRRPLRPQARGSAIAGTRPRCSLGAGGRRAERFPVGPVPRRRPFVQHPQKHLCHNSNKKTNLPLFPTSWFVSPSSGSPRSRHGCPWPLHAIPWREERHRSRRAVPFLWL